MRSLALLAMVFVTSGCMQGWATPGWQWSNPGASNNVQVPIGNPPPDAPIPDDVLPIYLHPGGARIVRDAARDDSTRWASVSLAAHVAEATFAPFEGSADNWNAIVQCTRNYFAGLPVQIVDRQPTRDDYLLVVVGGRAADAGLTGMWGIASLNDRQVTQRGVGLVFSADITWDRDAQTCESIAHEIGHLLGANHVAECHDLMANNSICARPVPRGGFLGETRPIIEAALAAWRASRVPPAPAVEQLVPELGQFTDGKADGWWHVWPIAITTTRPIASAVVRYTTPDQLKGEYHMAVQGLHASVRLPIHGPGQWTIVVEVRYTDGGVGRTQSFTGSIYGSP